MGRIKALENISATRAAASTFGVLVGLAGIEHGFFEMLQGNVTPSGIMIDAIGAEQRFWEYATETALTIIPNFLATGILATIFGLLVTILAYAFARAHYMGVRINMRARIKQIKVAMTLQRLLQSYYKLQLFHNLTSTTDLCDLSEVSPRATRVSFTETMINESDKGKVANFSSILSITGAKRFQSLFKKLIGMYRGKK